MTSAFVRVRAEREQPFRALETVAPVDRAEHAIRGTGVALHSYPDDGNTLDISLRSESAP